MKQRVQAYLIEHGVLVPIDSEEQLTLPLDKLQEFLDLLTPNDVPPMILQKLYRYQAEAVNILKAQVSPDGLSSSKRQNTEDKRT